LPGGSWTRRMAPRAAKVEYSANVRLGDLIRAFGN
jgi:hypothetical protein